MTKYETYLAKYETFINDLEELLREPNWREELNDIAKDIFLAYLYRKDLVKAPKKLFSRIRELDLKILSLGEKLKTLHPPVKHFSWLVNSHHPSLTTEAETVTKS